ncbi:MAG: hypothetical protein RSH52_28805 [Janthinobacterium sp.]
MAAARNAGPGAFADAARLASTWEASAALASARIACGFETGRFNAVLACNSPGLFNSADNAIVFAATGLTPLAANILLAVAFSGTSLLPPHALNKMPKQALNTRPLFFMHIKSPLNFHGK